VGQNPVFPQVDDLRIRFFVVNTGTVSITAKQFGSRLVSRYQSTKSTSINKPYLSEFYKRLPLYFLSVFFLSLGIYLIFLMLKLIYHFPLLSAPHLRLFFRDQKFIFWQRLPTKDRIGLLDFIRLLIRASCGVYIIGLMLLGGILGMILVTIFIKFLDFEMRIPYLDLGILTIIISLIIIMIMITVPMIIYHIALLLSKYLNSIPFFDNFLNRLNWLSAIIIAVSISLILTAINWIIYLPILSIFLFIIAILNLYFLIPVAHKFLNVPNYELPESQLVQETVVPKKAYSIP